VADWNYNEVGEAFDQLFRQHRRELLDYAMREGATPQDAEDIVQTTFLNAYQAVLAGNQPRQVRPWLYAIVRNVGRRIGSRRISVESLTEQPVPDEAEDAATFGELGEVIQRLPRNQREALLLRAIAGHDYSEIGRRLGTSVAAVEMLLFRARRTVQRQLAEHRRALSGLIPVPWRQLAASLTEHVNELVATRAGVVLRGALIVAAAATVGAASTPTHDRAAISRLSSPPFPARLGGSPPMPAPRLTVTVAAHRAFRPVMRARPETPAHAHTMSATRLSSRGAAPSQRGAPPAPRTDGAPSIPQTQGPPPLPPIEGAPSLPQTEGPPPREQIRPRPVAPEHDSGTPTGGLKMTPAPRLIVIPIPPPQVAISAATQPLDGTVVPPPSPQLEVTAPVPAVPPGEVPAPVAAVPPALGSPIVADGGAGVGTAAVPQPAAAPAAPALPLTSLP
jgi:RNA polymerase sigma-70 factor (ECF subfamily)